MKTYTYQPDPAAGFDTWIESVGDTANHGDEQTAYLGRGVGKVINYWRDIIIFDISDIPVHTKVLPGTKFEIAIAESNFAYEAEYAFWRLTEPNVTEMGATYLTYDGVNAWGTPGGDYSSPNGTFLGPDTDDIGWIEISGVDFEELVQDAIDYRSRILRILLLGEVGLGDENWRWYTSDLVVPTTVRPKLLVVTRPRVYLKSSKYLW